jgi:hypothetical protein
LAGEEEAPEGATGEERGVRVSWERRAERSSGRGGRGDIAVGVCDAILCLIVLIWRKKSPCPCEMTTSVKVTPFNSVKA